MNKTEIRCSEKSEKFYESNNYNLENEVISINSDICGKIYTVIIVGCFKITIYDDFCVTKSNIWPPMITSL